MKLLPAWLVLLVCVLSTCSRGFGQTTSPTVEDDLITLNFPENMELKTLVDYVSQRLSFNVSYQEEQLSNQRITIKAPTKIPASGLLGLLQSMLKARGLALIDGDQPGWKRIAPLVNSAVPTTRAAGAPLQPVAQVFLMKYTDAARVDAVIKPFLSGPSSSSYAIPDQHALIVVDFASNAARIAELVGLMDQPNQTAKIAFVAVHNADASQLAPQVKQILIAKSRAQALVGQNPEAVEVTQDSRTSQLVIVGPQAIVDDAAKVVESLDVAMNQQQSPVHFYKLANATAADVLDTLRSLEGDDSSQPTQRPSITPQSGVVPAFGSGASGNPGLSNLGSAGNGLGAQSGLAGGTSSQQEAGSLLPHAAAQSGAIPGTASEGAGGSQVAPQAIHTKRATIAADTNTNTIIVIAEPSVQKLYEQLIATLDKRRPQVLIEATIVELDTTHGFQLGVELSGHSKPGGKDQVVTFSSFGLSTPNPTTGQLALVPGLGFNGALISSDLAEVIIHALSSSGHSKVSSAPRILVNDNATGTLQSLSEQPFTSTNIGTSLSTTSFAGYAEAGTEITLTPHISEADYLQLEYQVALSSFTGTSDSTNGIPPPRQTDSVQSKVTIPDGSTVIVGGLNRTTYSKTINAVPILGQIPILGLLFGSRNISDENLTLFVFLRPVILRDDEFADLRFLSQKDVKIAGVSDGFPASAPLPIH